MTTVIPPLQPLETLKIPQWTERTLANGLTVIVVPRPSVPMVELRLWVPFGNAPLATSDVLGETLLSGTDTMSNVEIAAALQLVGGAMGVGVDPDRLLVSGNALVTGVDRMLEILGQVLTRAAYPSQEVGTERDRLADRIMIARSQPAHLARVALQRRVYRDHPYAVQTPEPEEVRAVTPQELRALHTSRVRPAGAILVLVGDVEPQRTLDAVAAALADWDGAGDDAGLPPVPPLAPGPLVLADRPNAVQSSLRLALPAVPRTHPDHAALQVANLIFGGYFSSRWVENIREDKGYTYGAHSAIDHSLAGSRLVVSADVATDVTAPALVETWYELGRLATLSPTQDELTQARQYLLGTLQLGLATQATVAGAATTYAGHGLRLDRLATYAEQVAALTVDDVAQAAATYMAPARGVAVVLGDATTVEAELARLVSVERVLP